MLTFRLGYGLPDFGPAVGAFINEVDCCKIPMRLDVSDIHRQQSNTARADDGGPVDDRVMLDVGWHIALLRKPKRTQPRMESIAPNQTFFMNSVEHL